MRKSIATLLLLCLLAPLALANEQEQQRANIGQLFNTILLIDFLKMGASVQGWHLPPDSIDRQRTAIRGARERLSKSIEDFASARHCLKAAGGEQAENELAAMEEQAFKALDVAEKAVEDSLHIVESGLEEVSAMGCSDVQILQRWIAMKRMEALAQQNALILNTAKGLGWSEGKKWGDAIAKRVHSLFYENRIPSSVSALDSRCGDSYHQANRKIHQAFIKVEDAVRDAQRHFLAPHLRDQSNLFEKKD